VSLDDVWTKNALDELAALPVPVQDQAEALVRELCRDPYGSGSVESASGRGLRLARAGGVMVLYQIDRAGELLYVAGVDWRR
jgi:mRNA-degrading endonuclease RelE of RelBE toxin-antitoxin system